MIRRHEVSDAEWELIKPLLPRPALGRPRLDDRTVLNGVVYPCHPRLLPVVPVAAAPSPSSTATARTVPTP
ncbi:transposase [Streptomyces gardneri]|uniref:transposase n=1 Tax=Streptomyces gardneri TaxID=66892 RepID=UPI001143BBB6